MSEVVLLLPNTDSLQQGQDYVRGIFVKIFVVIPSLAFFPFYDKCNDLISHFSTACEMLGTN